MAHDVPRSSSPSQRRLDRDARKALVAELPAELRRVYTAVLEQTLLSGAPVDPGALVVVLSALDDQGDDALTYRSSSLQALCWFGVTEFCADLGLATPPGCAEALFATVAITIADARFPTAGDPQADVFAALREVTSISSRAS